MIAFLHVLPDDVVPLHKFRDVVQLRRAGARVSDWELAHFLVVDDWPDNDWAAHLLLRGRDDQTYPYGQTDADGKLVQVSTRRPTLASFSAAEIEALRDPKRVIAPRKVSQIGTIATLAAVAGSTSIKQNEVGK